MGRSRHCVIRNKRKVIRETCNEWYFFRRCPTQPTRWLSVEFFLISMPLASAYFVEASRIETRVMDAELGKNMFFTGLFHVVN